jgi:molecular chaperone Hsp33
LANCEKLENSSEVLEHYMLREQLDTADSGVYGISRVAVDPVAACKGNLEGQADRDANEDQIGVNEDYGRIALLAGTLKREELLTLDVDTILHRLFWQEPITRFEPLTPRFACSCSRERVGNMLRSLGTDEIESIIAERGNVEVMSSAGRSVFDPVDAAQIFTHQGHQPPSTVQ